jgi:solute:Na+ symporter, SSS family
MGGALSAIDWLVIAGYFALVFSVAFWRTARARVTESSEGYFLAGRDAHWFVIGGSLFSSNIGAEHLVGLAGAGALTGVVTGQFEVLACVILLVLGWVFVPFYLRSAVYTMPEFLERRYSSAARWYLAVVSIIAYVLTKISITILAGGLVFETLMGVNIWVGAAIVVIATGIYTIFGGLRAVLLTDMLQTFVLIGGALAVVVIGLGEVGGWDAMWREVGPNHRSMWRALSDPDFPWTAILFGAPILGIWYWCTDQFIVQRTLSARNLDHARRGTIFGGYLKLLPLFLFLVPGVIAAALAKQGKLMLPEPDKALPTLVAELLPVGVRGLVVAGLLAALMSSLSSIFNSCSTLITLDVYKRLRPATPEKRLVRIGQVATGFLVVLGLLWIPAMRGMSQSMYAYLQSMQAYISPPIAAVFLLGLFWPRLNGRGAIASLVAGFVLGAFRLVAEKSGAALPGPLHDLATMHFLHFAVLLFVVCAAILVVGSFTAPAPGRAGLAGLTYATAGAPVASDRGWRRVDLALSLGLIGCVLALWAYFR